MIIKKGYFYSVCGMGLIVIVFFVIPYSYFGELNPTISAIGGLLFSIPIRFFWDSYTSPLFEIKDKPEIKEFQLHGYFDDQYKYIANRIIIKNRGKSAAKNCKGYIMVNDNKERVSWVVPTNGNVEIATINAKDEEKLDFCAFYESGPTDQVTPKIITPTEKGWTAPAGCRKLDGIEMCKALITADNAEPVEADIKISREEKKIEIKC